jgi:hypothetical protein
MDLLSLAAALLAFGTGWRVAHCKLDLEVDSPEPLWVRITRVFTG